MNRHIGPDIFAAFIMKNSNFNGLHGVTSQKTELFMKDRNFYVV
jgi:hypothetical protein